MTTSKTGATFTCTVRCRHTDAAVIYEYLLKNGIQPSSLSSLVRLSVANLANIILTNDLGEPVEFDRALEMLATLRVQPSREHQLAKTRSLTMGKLIGEEMKQTVGQTTNIPELTIEDIQRIQNEINQEREDEIAAITGGKDRTKVPKMGANPEESES